MGHREHIRLRVLHSWYHYKEKNGSLGTHRAPFFTLLVPLQRPRRYNYNHTLEDHQTRS
jgi:hypothetical protein